MKLEVGKKYLDEHDRTWEVVHKSSSFSYFLAVNEDVAYSTATYREDGESLGTAPDLVSEVDDAGPLTIKSETLYETRGGSFAFVSYYSGNFFDGVALSSEDDPQWRLATWYSPDGKSYSDDHLDLVKLLDVETVTPLDHDDVPPLSVFRKIGSRDGWESPRAVDRAGVMFEPDRRISWEGLKGYLIMKPGSKRWEPCIK